MPLLVVKDAETNHVAVYDATDDQVESFNSSTYLPVSVMGWPIYSPDDLAESSLMQHDLITMYREVNPRGEIPGEPTKRQLANIVFGSVQRLARPFDLTGADEKFYPPPEDAVKQTTRRKRRDPNTNRREPDTALKQCTEGTKQALLIDVFKTWSTCEAAAEVVGWKPSSIKSGIDYDLCTVKGYGWEKRVHDGVDQYRLLYPAGYDGPLPHKQKKS